MNVKTTQKEIRRIRNYYAVGSLADAEKLIERNERKFSDFQVIAYSVGMYGRNGAAIEDITTGDIYADAARTTGTFYFF